MVILLTMLSGLLALLPAQSRRTVPLDVYLIIDNSQAVQQSRSEIVAWVQREVIERMLVDGDTITIWAAGDRTRLVYSNTVTGETGKDEIKAAVQGLRTEGAQADFANALRELSARSAQTAQNQGRLSHSMVITASAEGLYPALTGSAQELLRWSRSEKYARWQVLVVAPHIGAQVRQAAAAYMSSQR